MASLNFEMLENVATGKVVTVGSDGLLRQYAFNQRNLGQHWLRSSLGGNLARFTCRMSGKVIEPRTAPVGNHTVLQQNTHTGGLNQRWRLEPTGAWRTFSIHAGDTQFVWDVPNASMADGMGVQLYQFHGGNNQRWRILQSEGLPEVVKITSVRTNLVLEVPGFAQHTGESIRQQQNNGGFNQLWELLRQPDGSCKLRSVCSGKLIDYPLQPAQQRMSAFVSQYDDNGGRNQIWRVEAASGGSVAIASAMNSFVLDLPGGSTAPGQAIQAYPSNGGVNQRWNLVTNL